MLKLIVHADDFGLSEKVNDGIVQAFRGGILTSTSIMANGAAFDHAVRLCRNVPTLDVGVHLTLVEEKPVLRAITVPSLVNREGRLHRNASIFVAKYMMGRIRLRELRDELEAQILKVRDRGIAPSHLDSHQHLHMLPEILKTIVELADKYNIAAIRFPYEQIVLRPAIGPRSVIRLLRQVVLNIFCRWGKKRISLRTDYFAGFSCGGNLHQENLQRLLQILPLEGTCELMCHPGLDDPDSLYFHWHYNWSNELRALLDPGVQDTLRRQGIQLMSYGQLVQQKRHDRANPVPIL
jgi:hopanoid biosynthesis associated protein HpnK